MTKKKLIITITSLCLVVVAAVAAVVGILAATQSHLNTQVKVTYTPNPNVIAKIGARYGKNGLTDSENVVTLLDDTDITYTTTNTEWTIGSTDKEIKLGEVAGSVENPYIVFEFSFKNTAKQNQDQSKYLTVAMENGFVTNNMTATLYYSAKAAEDLKKSTIENLKETAAVLQNIEGNGTNTAAYVYILVEAKLGETGSYGTLAGQTLKFNLTAKATNS